MLGDRAYLYLNSLSIIVLLCGKIPVSFTSDGHFLLAIFKCLLILCV